MKENDPEKIEGIVLIPGPARDYLNERQLVAYESHRREFIKWLARQGKNPDALEGYAHDTARNYASITDKFLRYVWDQDRYTTDIGHDEAEEYLRSLVRGRTKIQGITHTNKHMDCPICGATVGDSNYPNQVCDECDRRAVNENGDEPWHGWPPGEEPESEDGTIRMAPDHGENPVFIDGEKCWRRYRFGGWVTMKDQHDCDSLEEFYEAHGMM